MKVVVVFMHQFYNKRFFLPPEQLQPHSEEEKLGNIQLVLRFLESRGLEVLLQAVG